MSFIEGVQHKINKDNINQEMENISGYLPDKKAQELTVRFLKQNIRFTVEMLTGIKLFPFQEMLIKIMMNRDNVLLILSRGMSKSFTAAVFCYLHAIFEPGARIAILSRTFRQSRMILQTIEEFAEKKEASLLRECFSKPPAHKNDEWSIHIHKSKIIALPLGSGEKLRGFRFTLIVIDEFLLMPEKIVNEVIMPFLSTNRDPKKRAETIEKENALIKAGKMKEEDRTKFKNPKMVALSSASYKFEFLYKKYSDYINAIQNGYEIDGDTGKKKLLDGTYAVVQLAYDAAPHALYNQALIEQAKREMSAAQFKREFGSQFTDDSGGFYSAKSILACSVPDGEDETVELFGDKNGKYILSVDPSWAENDTSDHFAMVVMKMDTESWNYKPVHFYAVAGGKLKDHIAYFCYILENFNLEFVILDNAGGVTFVNALNESEVFKKMKKEVLLISNQDVKLNDKTPDEWETYINEARAQYNKKENRYAYAQVFSPEWIRKINERLQSDIDNRRIKFPAKIEANFGKFENIKNQLIGKNLNSVKFLDAEEIAVSDYDKWEKDSDDEIGAPRNQLAKVVDLIERQDELLELSKRQIASIEARNTDNGGLRFDIPRELKVMKGANRPRKDLYSAILLGSWGVKIYQAIQSLPPDETPDWEPIGFN